MSVDQPQQQQLTPTLPRHQATQPQSRNEQLSTTVIATTGSGGGGGGSGDSMQHSNGAEQLATAAAAAVVPPVIRVTNSDCAVPPTMLHNVDGVYNQVYSNVSTTSCNVSRVQSNSNQSTSPMDRSIPINQLPPLTSLIQAAQMTSPPSYPHQQQHQQQLQQQQHPHQPYQQYHQPSEMPSDAPLTNVLQPPTDRTRPPRRKPRKWTEQETKDLLKGCQKYGLGAWKRILRDTEFHFDNRTSVDLKDRFRTIKPNEYRRHYTERNAKRRGEQLSPEEEQQLQSLYVHNNTSNSNINNDDNDENVEIAAASGSNTIENEIDRNDSIQSSASVATSTNVITAVTTTNETTPRALTNVASAPTSQKSSGNGASMDTAGSASGSSKKSSRKYETAAEKWQSDEVFERVGRQATRRYTDEEDQRLREGAIKYNGKWSLIAQDDELGFRGKRNGQSLRDRLRALDPDLFKKVTTTKSPRNVLPLQAQRTSTPPLLSSTNHQQQLHQQHHQHQHQHHQSDMLMASPTEQPLQQLHHQPLYQQPQPQVMAGFAMLHGNPHAERDVMRAPPPGILTQQLGNHHAIMASPPCSPAVPTPMSAPWSAVSSGYGGRGQLPLPLNMRLSHMDQFGPPSPGQMSGSADYYNSPTTAPYPIGSHAAISQPSLGTYPLHSQQQQHAQTLAQQQPQKQQQQTQQHVYPHYPQYHPYHRHSFNNQHQMPTPRNTSSLHHPRSSLASPISYSSHSLHQAQPAMLPPPTPQLHAQSNITNSPQQQPQTQPQSRNQFTSGPIFQEPECEMSSPDSANLQPQHQQQQHQQQQHQFRLPARPSPLPSISASSSSRHYPLIQAAPPSVAMMLHKNSPQNFGPDPLDIISGDISLVRNVRNDDSETDDDPDLINRRPQPI